MADDSRLDRRRRRQAEAEAAEAAEAAVGTADAAPAPVNTDWWADGWACMRSRRVGGRRVDMTMAAAASAEGEGVDVELVTAAGAASSETTFLIRPGVGGALPPDPPPAAAVPDWPDMYACGVCFSPALLSKQSEVESTSSSSR